MLSSGNTARQRSRLCRAKQNESGLLPEVLEYDAYLEQHGETDGWREEDHREYLRHSVAR